MWIPIHAIAVWLYRHPTDMRKSYDGLSALVKNAMNANPLGGGLFVFVNRRKTQMKCLYFAGDGYCIWAKRLERGQFRVCFDAADTARIDLSTLTLLIEGIDLNSVRRFRRYRSDFTGEMANIPVQ